jgi:hypothetical protein
MNEELFIMSGLLIIAFFLISLIGQLISCWLMVLCAGALEVPAIVLLVSSFYISGENNDRHTS